MPLEISDRERTSDTQYNMEMLASAGNIAAGSVRKVGNKLSAGKQKNILKHNESAANSRMVQKDTHSGKLQSNGVNRNLRISDSSRMVSDKTGNRRIEHYSERMNRTESKLQKKMRKRYKREMAIRGGIVSPLKIETSMKSKLRSNNLAGGFQYAGDKAHSGLKFINEKLDSDSMGIQKAWTDAADKGVTGIRSVYRVSHQVKHFRAVRKEKEIAKLLRKEDKIAKATFKAEYQQAYKAFKDSAVGHDSSFLLKQKQKRFLKKKYMKNAMKEYQKAKKAGQAAKTVYSTGLSVADKAKSLLKNIIHILRDTKAWIVLIAFAALLILPSIMSAVMTLFIGIFGGSSNSKTATGTGFPDSVLQWKEFVEERCAANNDTGSNTDLNLFVNAILTTIWQESGGNPDGNGVDGDIMQCKACGLWDDSQMPSDWSVAEKSIDVGIRYFYSGLKQWGVTDPEDYDGLQIVAQGYNYGFGFLDYMRTENANKWTLELSTLFSNAHGSSYGTKSYGQEWLDKYVQGSSGGSGEVVAGAGAEYVLQTAQNQVGITETDGDNNVVFNTDYYGHEVHDGEPDANSAYPWCCVFVWWCFNKSGNGAAFYDGGKTANCRTVADWASQEGLWINKAEVQAGDLVLFKSGSSGWSHIEIVAGIEGNTIHTIGGNTTPEAGSGNEYNGGAVAARNRAYSNTTHYFVRPQWNKVKN